MGFQPVPGEVTGVERLMGGAAEVWSHFGDLGEVRGLHTGGWGTACALLRLGGWWPPWPLARSSPHVRGLPWGCGCADGALSP